MQNRWFALNAGASNWLWLSLAIIVADQWTKYLVVMHFEEFEFVTVWPLLDLMRLHTVGAAFSFLSQASGWQRCLFTALGIAVSVLILVWLRRLPSRGQHVLAAGLALVSLPASARDVDVVWRPDGQSAWLTIEDADISPSADGGRFEAQEVLGHLGFLCERIDDEDAWKARGHGCSATISEELRWLGRQ